MSCGCKDTIKGNKKHGGDCPIKGNKRSYHLRMKDNDTAFYPPDPCVEHRFGEECIKLPNLICQTNDHFCGACIPLCSYVQLGVLVDDCTECCEDGECRGIIANFFYPSYDHCDDTNMVGELWSLLILSNGSKILLKSRSNVPGNRCNSFEIRRRCYPVLSCQQNIVTHIASGYLDVVGIYGCLEGREGCCELLGTASLDYQEGENMAKVLETQKDDGCLSMELDWHYKLCLVKPYCDDTPAYELTC